MTLPAGCRRDEEQRELSEQFTIHPIEQAQSGRYSPQAQAYFEHYGLDGDWFDGEHLFGTFVSEGFTLAGHLYKPAESTATVVLLHGYLNHSGQFKNLIRFLTEHGFAAAVYDLPGHGLSSGERAAIDSFDTYVQTTQDFLTLVSRHLLGPLYTVGFSTGAAILIEMLRRGEADRLAKIVLAAPLIRWSGYEQSKGTYKVYKKFTDKIARFHRKNSSDKAYLVFNKTQDYLHCKHLSLTWVKALFEWNRLVEAMEPCHRAVRVIQGDKDGTVDWRYNLELIREKLPQAEIRMIGGANHELFNEAPDYKRQALEAVDAFFRQDIQD